jgi:FKBP-type peptidyl-prolyl cis-trans isomerase 2
MSRSIHKLLRVAIVAALGAGAVASAAEAKPAAGAAKPAVADGMQVSLEYALTDDKGAAIEDNKGKPPLVYTHGGHHIVPGLEKAMTGLHVGDEKDVKVPPEEGYGPVNPNAYQEVPQENLPPGTKVGAILRATSPSGQELPVRVAEMRDKTALIDFNHPMAGRTLLFHVKVLDVKKAPELAAEAMPAPEAKPGADAKTAP